MGPRWTQAAQVRTGQTVSQKEGENEDFIFNHSHIQSSLKCGSRSADFRQQTKEIKIADFGTWNIL